MPSFCRHNRLIQNCPICAREQNVELRPVVTPGGYGDADRGSTSKASSRARPSVVTQTATGTSRGRRTSAGLRVRRVTRDAEDGYRSDLVPGLKSAADARRLVDELAFASGRLAALAADPPGLYAAVADPGIELEERTWLAFQIAYVGPLDGPDPFASISSARSTWSSGEPPVLDGATLGPRTAHDPVRGTRTLEAYRAWAHRAGSQQSAFTGESGWTPERRFDRVFERLSLPGLNRGARFDLLVTLGRARAYELRAGSLHLGGTEPVTTAAKRILGIGDVLLLHRRAAELAAACELPLEALDLGFFNWERRERATAGIPADAGVDERARASASSALGLLGSDGSVHDEDEDGDEGALA